MLQNIPDSSGIFSRYPNGNWPIELSPAPPIGIEAGSVTGNFIGTGRRFAAAIST
jgi:hypothetical protein